MESSDSPRIEIRTEKISNNPTKWYNMNIEKSCHNFELCNATLGTIKKDFCLPGPIRSPWSGWNMLKGFERWHSLHYLYVIL